MNVKINLGSILGGIICLVLLAKTGDPIKSYIALAGLIYLLGK